MRGLLTAACLLLPGLVSAGTVYVSPTGADNNPGTFQAPFRTLAKGVSVLGPGDTLLVRGGTYAESLHGNIPSGESWARPVTLKAFPGEQVIIRPDSAMRVLHFQSQHYIVVDGFVLDAANVQYDAVKIAYGYTSPAAHHIRIMNCEVKNAPKNGILIVGTGGDGNELINVNVHHNGLARYGHGLYICTDSNLVSGCSFHHNAGWGVHIYSEAPDPYMPDRNVVRGCRSYDNGQSGSWCVGIGVYAGADNLVVNNVTWGHTVGFEIDYGVSGTRLLNNVAYDNYGFGVYVGRDSQGGEIRNNILYGNGTGLVDDGAGTARSHNMVATNPQFVDPGMADFRLQPGSPAIDAGAALAEVTTDINGTARPQGAGHDLGAYEYVSGDDVRPAMITNLRVVAAD
jgi:parallel beta-helix repeat protein